MPGPVCDSAGIREAVYTHEENLTIQLHLVELCP
jgi:hypothetical protein